MAAPISTTYQPAERERIIAHVLSQVACGRAVTTILKLDDAMPSIGTFWNWVRADEKLLDELASARDIGIEAALEDAQAIADGDDAIPLDGLSGIDLFRAMVRNDPKRARLRYDARIKRAQMLKPKTYGPKLDVTTDGGKLGSDNPGDKAAQIVTILDQVAKRVETRDDGLDPRTLDLLG